MIKLQILSYENIEKYLARLILIGVVGLPSYYDYWYQDELLLKAVKYLIKNTFENIQYFIYSIHPEPVE